MLDYLRMLRINDWIKFYPTIPLAGAILAGAAPWQMLLIFMVYFSLIGYAFVVNNYFDVQIDLLHREKVEKNKNPLASGTVSRKGVRIIMLLLVGVTLFSMGLSSLGFVLVILNILLATAYSGWLRLKERPFLDIITHGLMFGAIPFMAGFALVQGRLTQEILLLSLPPFLLGCEALIAHQVMEYEMDINVTRTTVTRIGQQRGMLLLGALALTSVVLLIALAPLAQIPSWIVMLAGWYLLAYPAYSCRGMYRDIRYRASAE